MCPNLNPNLYPNPNPNPNQVADLSAYEAALEGSWVYEELRSVRHTRLGLGQLPLTLPLTLPLPLPLEQRLDPLCRERGAVGGREHAGQLLARHLACACCMHMMHMMCMCMCM